MPIPGCWQKQKAGSSVSPSLRRSLGGQFKPPALGVCADSCSLSFWNHQLKPVLFFFPSRAEKRMEFPFRETLLRALLGNGVNFHKVFSPKAEMSVSTSSNYITIPFPSDNQFEINLILKPVPLKPFLCPFSQTYELPKTEEPRMQTAWRKGGDSYHRGNVW